MRFFRLFPLFSLILFSACDVLNVEDELFQLNQANQSREISDKINVDIDPEYILNCYPEIYVTSTAQENHVFDICDGVGDCNLVDAIETANLCKGITVIHLQEGATYYLSEPAYFNEREQEDGNYKEVTSREYKGNGLPAVNSIVIIEGHGATIKRGEWSFGSINYNDREMHTAKKIAPFRILMNKKFGILTLRDVKIIGGDSSEDIDYGGNGGGIYNEGKLILERVVLEKNRASNHGGGLFSYGYGKLEVIESNITENKTVSQGGGMFCDSPLIIVNSSISHNNAQGGGGMHLGYSGSSLNIPDQFKNGNSLALVDQCIIENNEATALGGGIKTSNAETGAMGYPEKFGNIYLEIKRSTISENTARRGGGVMNWSGVIHMYDVSIIANQATEFYEQGAGGGMHFEFGHTFLNNSVLALNTIGGDVGGLTADANHIHVQNINFIGDQTFIHSNILHGDPMLNPISVYGDTKVYVPINGSPLIDAGNTTGLSLDQRGLPRPVGTSYDIGAVEVQ